MRSASRRPHLVAASVVLVLGLVSCTSSSGAEGPPATASTSAVATTSATSDVFHPDIDSRPTLAVVTVDDIYVTSAGSARYSPQVYRIDAQSGAIVGHRTSTGQPNGAAIAPDGQLWVACTRHPDQPTGSGISVYDATTMVVAEHLPVPGQALSVLRVGDTMWVGSTGHVYELDPADGAVLRAFTITGSAYQMAIAGTNVVVGGGSTVEVLSADGVRVAQRDVGGDGSLRLAAGGGDVWVRVPVGEGGKIYRLDASTLADEMPPLAVGSPDGGLVATPDGAWAVDRETSELVFLDASGAHRQLALDITAALAATPDGDVLLSRLTGLSYGSELR